MAEWLAGPGGSLAVASLLTFLVAAESRWLPWAPFFPAYALLALLIPLAAGGWTFGDLAGLWEAHAGAMVGVGAAMLAWELGFSAWFYERVILARRGKADDPHWSPTRAMEDLSAEAGSRVPLGKAGAPAVFAFFTLVWAPLGEELFYWGYLYGNLRLGLPFPAAALITSACFGIRHALHFLYPPGGRFPWPAAAWLAGTTLVTGLLNSWLYERIGALLPLILIHLAANLLFAAYAFAASRGSARG